MQEGVNRTWREQKIMNAYHIVDNFQHHSGTI
jgi:hypothetical protein